MMRYRFDRRSMLRGMLGGAAVFIGLPLFEGLLNTHGEALADGSAFPRRFGIFFWGNGTLPERFRPVLVGDDYELSEQLMPLAAFRPKLTVVSGMKVMTGNTVAHWSGIGGFLTGEEIEFVGESSVFTAATLDQKIAQSIGAETRFRSIECGAFCDKTLSYNGREAPNPFETNPAALFERVFGGGFRAPGDDSAPDPTLRLQRSVLDAVVADAKALGRALGKSDQARLDQHLTGIRELERRIQKLEQDPPQLAACLRPGQPPSDYPDIEGRPQLAEKNRVFAQLIAMALACDQTRVFFDQLTSPISRALFPGASDGHHALTHNEPGDQPEVNAITKYCIGQMAVLLEELDAIAEGDGTLLDHTVVLGTSDVSQGRSHSVEEFPILLVGSAGGRLKTGTHYRPPAAENTSKVGLTLLRAMGVRATSFGVGEGMVSEGINAIEVG